MTIEQKAIEALQQEFKTFEGKVVALLRRLSPADGWRPISEAPKDGTRIDVWCVWSNSGGVGTRLTDVSWRGDNSGWGWTNFHSAGSVDWEYVEKDGPTQPAWKPTHWRPLPASPLT